MFAYAMLGAGAVVAVYLLVRSRKTAIEPGVMNLCDNLVYVGTAFLTIGMLFGALWAKAVSYTHLDVYKRQLAAFPEVLR